MTPERQRVMKVAEQVILMCAKGDVASGNISSLDEMLATSVIAAESDLSTARAEIGRLRTVCAEAYQLAGAVGAPAKVLDNLSYAAQGAPDLPHTTFLPILPEDCAEIGRLLEAANKAETHAYKWGMEAFRLQEALKQAAKIETLWEVLSAHPAPWLEAMNSELFDALDHLEIPNVLPITPPVKADAPKDNTTAVASCGHLVFVRSNGNIVAHRDANGCRCYTSETPIAMAGSNATEPKVDAVCRKCEGRNRVIFDEIRQGFWAARPAKIEENWVECPDCQAAKGDAGNRAVIYKPAPCVRCHCSQTLPIGLQACRCECHPDDRSCQPARRWRVSQPPDATHYPPKISRDPEADCRAYAGLDSERRLVQWSDDGGVMWRAE